jgi:hypothetical protein
LEIGNVSIGMNLMPWKSFAGTKGGIVNKRKGRKSCGSKGLVKWFHLLSWDKPSPCARTVMTDRWCFLGILNVDVLASTHNWTMESTRQPSRSVTTQETNLVGLCGWWIVNPFWFTRGSRHQPGQHGNEKGSNNGGFFGSVVSFVVGWCWCWCW